MTRSARFNRRFLSANVEFTCGSRPSVLKCGQAVNSSFDNLGVVEQAVEVAGFIATSVAFGVLYW